jgi:hypothetical protein
MKYIYLLLITVLCFKNSSAQIIFSNSAGNLTLQTYSAGATTTHYTTVPTAFSTIEDGFNNNVGLSVSNPNQPFNVPALKTAGWAVVYNQQDNDTFFVSTSWLDSAKATSRWLITPQITGIVPNTVLTWKAKSPDPTYADAYEVYGTAKTGTLTSVDFTIGDRLFSIANYSTSSGGENSSWTSRSINLTPFAGQNLRFAFKNYSTDKYQLWIDDIQVITLTNSLDLGITAIKADKYILTNTQKAIGLSYSNYGATAVNSILLNYKIGTSSVQTESISLNNPINYLETNTFTFSLPYSISSAGLYPLKCWISSVNGQQDQSQLNDTLVMNITVQNSSPKKHVLVEQFVSANDGESCYSQSVLTSLKNDSTIIAVNVHDADSLKDSRANALISAYKKNFSTATINRNFDDSLGSVALPRTYYSNRINKQLTAITPVSVSLINTSYQSLTKTLTFTVKADFTGEVKGDYRLNAYLTENNVSGSNADTTVNGFNQLNNYYNAPWSPFYQTGYFSNTYNTYVLKSWQYKHQNVLVYSFDFTFGLGGTILQTGGTQGQSFQKTYTLTLPTLTTGISKYNPDNIYIVGFVAEYSTNNNACTILNVAQTKLTSNPEVVGINEGTTTGLEFKLYPNPSSGNVFLSNSTLAVTNYQIKVADVLGNCVYWQNFYNTLLPKHIDLTALNDGVYVLSINSNQHTCTQKIIIKK